ncbi:Large T antigen [Araneus ventricosus]|uniref:Large T antigen n=1 Tax=Araneus ventricosus TaxID=182803 RepID=A0A4Y2VIM4_ARAVE|nr:Large T antigen [Araneus ventricosus]
MVRVIGSAGIEPSDSFYQSRSPQRNYNGTPAGYSIPLMPYQRRGSPRNRYCNFKGDFKCGKISFENGFLKFFEGVNINVKVEKFRLPFYLGQAIGKRFVLFHDVKGRQHSGSNLAPGQGFLNLDDLSYHLYGHVEVQLEQKNKQPMLQLFRPGIITCNDYEVPESIKERVVGPIKVYPSKYWGFHPVNVIEETIYIGCVFQNLLSAEPEIHRHISLQVSKWWRKEWSNNCSCLQVKLFPYIQIQN